MPLAQLHVELLSHIPGQMGAFNVNSLFFFILLVYNSGHCVFIFQRCIESTQLRPSFCTLALRVCEENMTDRVVCLWGCGRK